jgi:hypothetical protein
MTLNGDVPPEAATIGSLVIHETLSVIDEHITGMSNAPTTRAASTAATTAFHTSMAKKQTRRR